MALPTDRPLQQAREALLRLKGAQTYDKAAGAWEDFLIQWHRCVNKCDAYTKKLYGKGWRPVREQIQADEMLLYLRIARNSDEHGIESITESRDRIRTIGVDGSVFVRKLVVKNGIVKDYDVLPLEGGSNIKFGVDQEGLRLLPVTDRTGTYDPPTSHKGRDIDPSDIVQIAELALEFIEDAVRFATTERPAE